MDLWEKLRRDSARIFPQIHISVVLMAKFPIEAPQSDGAFFPLNGREALAKKSFSVAGKIRGRCWLKALAQKGFARCKESILHNLTL
ncbi:hypothetical protein ACLB9Y_04645 [Chryseobacterium scophthalmum]|uniref:hypothetical protein n=1 Tax=Chryseobacterium scophthalmum TaxID=59733 RepID=UPI00398AF84A